MKNISRLINTAAFVEAATGLALLASPSLVTKLLLDVNSTGIASIVCRIAGIALVALAVACLQGKARLSSGRGGPVAGLLIYNLLAGLLLVDVGFASADIGWLLWPAAVIHLLFAALFILVPMIGRTKAVVAT